MPPHHGSCRTSIDSLAAPALNPTILRPAIRAPRQTSQGFPHEAATAHAYRSISARESLRQNLEGIAILFHEVAARLDLSRDAGIEGCQQVALWRLDHVQGVPAHHF